MFTVGITVESSVERVDKAHINATLTSKYFFHWSILKMFRGSSEMIHVQEPAAICRSLLRWILSDIIV